MNRNLVCLLPHPGRLRTVLGCLLCLPILLGAQTQQPDIPRIESVRMASRQPQENSQSLIWFDDFDIERLYTESSGPQLDNTTRFGNYGKAMRCFYAAGSQGSGNRKVFFGDTPYTALARAGVKFDEVYWRIYVKHQAGWTGGGPAKMSRATSLITATDWRQMMISHVWSSGESLTLDPASGVPAGKNYVVTTSYNDFGNLRWMGNKPISDFKISSTEESGWWVCVEARCKLNTPGQSDGENQLWIDGKLECERLNVDWRGSYDNFGINAVFLEAYWNSGSPVEQNRWYDNFVISTSRIGPVVTSRNPELFKTPYSGPGSQDAWEVRIALDRDGRRVVWSSNPVTDGDSVVVGASAGTFSGSLANEIRLAPGTTYYLRVRQQSDEEAWSDWSYWHQEFMTEGDPEPDGMGCDFNGDGRLGVADALALLIFQLRNPGDLRGDINGDNVAGVADVVILLRDIMTGFCGPGLSSLAAAEGLNGQIEALELTAGEGEALRESLPVLGLTESLRRRIETALDRTGSLPGYREPFALMQNSPNPFNPRTSISYSLPESAGGVRVSLKVFDLRNKVIRTLVDAFRTAGTYTVFWDGNDEQDNPVANGVYLYRMRAGEFAQTRKMVLLR
ncbi:MAG: hypothetical protein FVQ81_02980 [Candidatus Glassbacteria bacterium]|nr:hypothetical protein [Candidatus Glassbacteria bacterium]